MVILFEKIKSILQNTNMDHIENIRQSIDNIDQQLIELLAKRFLCSEKIAKEKKKNDLPIFDPNREEQLFEAIETYAKSAKFEPRIAHSIFQEIIHQSRMAQERKIKKQ